MKVILDYVAKLPNDVANMKNGGAKLLHRLVNWRVVPQNLFCCYNLMNIFHGGKLFHFPSHLFFHLWADDQHSFCNGPETLFADRKLMFLDFYTVSFEALHLT